MTMTTLNAPGSPPSLERVDDVARRVLSIDDPDAPTPAWFIGILHRFLTEHPGDDHFILELPDSAEPARGGNGYGAVTCMEDECWSNINLSADPDRPDGGKSYGVGSLWEYAMHCQIPDHIKCRTQRLRRMGHVLPEALSTAVLPRDVARDFSSPQAGPSRFAYNAAPKHNAFSLSFSPILRNQPVNHPALTPSSSLIRRPDFIDSDSDNDDGNDSDSEIEFMGRKSPSLAIVDVGDSDEDVKPAIGSSQLSHPRSSQAKTPAGGQSRRWIPVWSAMSLSDRRLAITQELRDLSKPSTPSSFEAIRAVSRRRDALRVVEGSGCLMQWTPPDPLVFQAFSNLYVHPRLAGTFERLKPALSEPAAGPSGHTSTPVAGPSTQHATPGAYAEFVRSLASRAAVLPEVVKAAWQRIGQDSRMASLMKEHNVLKQALTRYDVDPRFQGVAFLLRDRLNSLNKVFTNGTWMPPSLQLLRFIPELRHTVHPSLLPYLPAIPDEGDDLDAFGMREEWNRPTGPALTDYFKDALHDFQDDATVEEASKVLGLDANTERLPGANFTLMAHQVLGVAFMVKREQRTGKGGRGGMLCDAMGLGKTIQTIGLMLARNERPPDFERAPQLIVAPLALLTQWKGEIEERTLNGWRVYIHHGQGRLKSVAQIRNFDVVLTTYGTLCSESGITKAKKKQRLASSDDEADDYVAKKKRGPLFKIDWFRVVLDEAHNVRNRQTISARAVLELDVLHAWCLTGTPIVNSLGDVGPLLEFIGAMDISEYQSQVVKREKRTPKNAARRCQAILKPLMLRRNKETELNGKRILELPPKTVNLAYQEFELDERAIYAAIEQRARVKVTKYLKAGTVLKNYHVVLVLLTRLRQAVNHPWLLRRKPGDEGAEDDLLIDDAAFGADLGQCRDNDEAEFGRAVAILGKPVVDVLVKKLQERDERMNDEDDTNQDVDCSICYEPFDGTEVITPCGHLYCRACISNYFISPVRDASDLTDEDVNAGCRSCPMCRSKLQPGHVFRCVAFFRPQVAPPMAEEENDVIEDIKPDVKPSIEGDRKGKKRANAAEAFFGGLKTDLTNEDEKPDPKRKRGDSKGKGRATSVDDDSDADFLEEQIPPSTKMRRTLELVQQWLDEDPTTKILIFSQFTAYLDLLQAFLKDNGITTVGYRGSMSASAREEAIRRFRTPSGITDPLPVMLISTKAGGVGLNLTMAHKVIMCDLAWNPATEQQAVDRSHRIGQSKAVGVERLIIRETVEDRLLAIQEHKGLLADGAMGEGAIGRLGRLTLDDIRKLFAISANDEE
ncbi:hypothetical protein CC85DRAFT_310121 [Cutaneotrichosporon oleaginosum]|uniref:Uncharacterized protein n=1 Tax=Cutaneotrichosporon oleaginosum TaxID=879819 RepID=A0A0J0XYH4_9TREE|nr:uncharacterized protein CC85DRAFT_310121 [Cutaneotrichosporon oleaginosum]KLT46105.1 hypothetical protein CC85DRAFT_310121 [Cutaneotrichosporon oleaginosum]TXT10117.1 hypothetical protein COLE_04051 [Cutaneotrichosporon oleaginosum]